MFRFISRLFKQCCKYLIEFIRRVTLCVYILIKGVDLIVTVYVTLIINSRKTWDQVPVNLRDAVASELESMGLGTDGKPLPKEAPKKK